MIDSQFHVQINGVKYRLAEDSEGQHYTKRREPLRLQSNAIVQGASGKFQLRPDIQEWRITDFSGGEGRVSWDDEAANEYYRGYDIDPFAQPGNLQLARALEFAKDSTGSADFNVHVILVTAGGKLFGVDISDSTYGVYEWDDANEKFLALNASSQTDEPVNGVQAIGTGFWVYYSLKDGGTGSADSHEFYHVVNDNFTETTASLSTDVLAMCASTVRGYMFFAQDNALDGSITVLYERNSALDPAVEIYRTGEGANPTTAQFWPLLSAGPNAVFMITHQGDEGPATLHKAEPTAGAVAGSGEQVAKFEGFSCHAMFYHLGLVLMCGRQEGKSVILYYDDVNGTFGALAELSARDGSWQDESKWIFSAHMPNLGFKAAFLHHSGPDSEDDQVSIMIYNALTGGVAGTSVHDPGSVTRDGVKPSLVTHRGEVFFVDDVSGDYKVVRQLKDEFTDRTGIYESAINDFDLLDDKILTTIALETEPLPADTSVVVKYQLDQDGTWLTAGTHDTDGAVEKVFTISTDTTTRSFSNLQLRLELSNGGTTTVTPIIRSVRARATVAKGVRVWDLLVKCDDELGKVQNRSWDGSYLRSNIETAGDSESVVAFLDGYGDRAAGTYDEYDVIVDDYTVIQDRPGEGVVRTRLREVT